MKCLNRSRILISISYSLIIIFFISKSGRAERLEKKQENINICWSGPLTGQSAVLGIDSLNSMILAIEEANARGTIQKYVYKLYFEDDQFDTTKSLSAYTKLVSQHKCQIIIASTYSGVFAIAQRAKHDQVVIIDPLDCNEKIANLSENVFCIATQSESVGEALTHKIKDQRHNSVGIIFDQQNPFMELVKNIISDKLNNFGFQVQIQAIDANTADFKSQLLRFKQSKINGLVLLGGDGIGKAMLQARQLGLKAQFYTVGTITSASYQKLAGKAANGSLVAFWEAPRTSEYQNYISEFTNKYGRAPILELASIPTYDAIKIVIKVINELHGNNDELSYSNLISALLKIQNYKGVSGNISIDPDGAVRTIKEKIYTFVDGVLK